MSIVKRISVKTIPDTDTGIDLKKAFELIKNSDFEEEIINQFGIDLDENLFINIKGAKTLVDAVINLESRIQKFDIDTEIKNIHISQFNENKTNQIDIELSKISHPFVAKNYKTDMISASSKYSVRKDILDDLYKADKFLSNLRKLDCEDLIQTNIKELEELTKDNSNTKKLRYVEGEDGKLYVRAITSTNLYKDYNIAFSVFVALYQLNILNSQTYNFEVERFSFDESEISVIFKETNKVETIKDNVTLSFALELSNSEIKNKAVKLNGRFIIETGDFAILPKNNSLSTDVLSIRHNNVLKTAKKNIAELPENISEFITNSTDSYKNIGKLKKFEDIQKYLLERLQKSNITEVRKYSSEFQKVLKGRIKTLVELLEKLDKLQSVIKDEDIKAIDFLREKIYDSIIKSGN